MYRIPSKSKSCKLTRMLAGQMHTRATELQYSGRGRRRPASYNRVGHLQGYLMRWFSPIVNGDMDNIEDVLSTLSENLKRHIVTGIEAPLSRYVPTGDSTPQ